MPLFNLPQGPGGPGGAWDAKHWQEDPRSLLSWSAFKERLPAQVGGGPGTQEETEAEWATQGEFGKGCRSPGLERPRFSLC